MPISFSRLIYPSDVSTEIEIFSNKNPFQRNEKRKSNLFILSTSISVATQISADKLTLFQSGGDRLCPYNYYWQFSDLLTALDLTLLGIGLTYLSENLGATATVFPFQRIKSANLFKNYFRTNPFRFCIGISVYF